MGDSDASLYKESRYVDMGTSVKAMLTKTGWKPEYVAQCVPFIPISGFYGENLLSKSSKMPWWTGCNVKNLRGDKVCVVTLLDALNTYCTLPIRHTSRKIR